MSAWISWTLIGTIYNLLYCYLFVKLTNHNDRIFQVKSILLSVLFSLLNCYVIQKGMLISPIVMNVCSIFILYLSYQISFSQATITALLFSVIVFISKMIISILLHIHLVELQYLQEIIISNLACIVLVILLIHNRKIQQCIVILLKWCTNNKALQMTAISILSVSTLFILLKENLIQWNSLSPLFIINLFITCIVVFVILYLKENNRRNKLIQQYDRLLMYLQGYEKLIIEKSKEQHEYKNQLIILRGLIHQKNKKAIAYIDNMLNINRSETNYDWLAKLNNILSDGLKGLIYYKISQMQDRNIDIMVNISPELNSKKLWKVCDTYLQDVSRIIGVYLDNAMEAAMNASKKYIIIETELHNKDIIFTFSNTYSGLVDIENMDSPGFSTKGKGKGYGLPLVKDIVQKNQHLEQQREINGIYYVQKLIIKQ